MSLAFTSTLVPARALAQRLDELSALIERTSDVDYVARPRGGVSGSVGAHVRHCLDHVHALLDAAPAGVVSYDHRRRHPALEERREVAVAALRAAVDRLEHTVPGTPDAPVVLDTQVDRDGAPVQVSSSLARELVFVLQHTIHHQALVAVLLAERGVPVPLAFGYAPSTPRPAA